MGERIRRLGAAMREEGRYMGRFAREVSGYDLVRREGPEAALFLAYNFLGLYTLVNVAVNGFGHGTYPLSGDFL